MSAGVHGVHGENVSFIDVQIKIPDRKYDQGDVNDVMHRIWEKSGSWVPASEEEGWPFGTRWGLKAGATRGGGGWGRGQMEKSS